MPCVVCVRVVEDGQPLQIVARDEGASAVPALRPSRVLAATLALNGRAPLQFA